MHVVLGHSLMRLPCLPRLCGRGILECTSISRSRRLRREPILKPASYRYLVVSEAPRRSQLLLMIWRKTWFSGWWVRTRNEGPGVEGSASSLVIGIDHDTVCAGVGGTAIRHSTSCAGRRAAAPAGTTSAVPDGSTTHDSADRISGQFLFYHDHNFTKSKGNLRFQRHVPLFVPIGVCVTTHDDGTASDVTIGMWRHNQQATNHERNGKPWFSFPK